MLLWHAGTSTSFYEFSLFPIYPLRTPLLSEGAVSRWQFPNAFLKVRIKEGSHQLTSCVEKYHIKTRPIAPTPTVKSWIVETWRHFVNYGSLYNCTLLPPECKLIFFFRWFPEGRIWWWKSSGLNILHLRRAMLPDLSSSHLHSKDSSVLQERLL